MTHARAPRGRSTTRVRLIASIAWCAAIATSTHAAQVVVDGPVGSGEFGRSVTILPNGNIVVTDPGFDAPGPVVDAGAVLVYRPDGSLTSSLTGSTSGSRVGSGGVVVLANGHYLVLSPQWSDGANFQAGAATFRTSTSVAHDGVGPNNSLVGDSALDSVGSDGAVALPNGNFLVLSSQWSNGAAASAGAVTFGDGEIGISGVVSAANSLVGSSAGDQVGRSGAVVLSNGNYVVQSRFWQNVPGNDAGAATFGSGATGVVGVVSADNSLVGSSAFDRVGSDVVALANGNYVVVSPGWQNGGTVGAGAVTFGSGTAGVSGVVSTSNSLAGSSELDLVGEDGVTALASGNYVVISNRWNNGPVVNAGAVTFASGTTGVSGEVSQSNSLVGTSAGIPRAFSVTPLSNGNYVVSNPGWDNGALLNVGAVALASGTSGITGVMTSANSLIGSSSSDSVGSAGVTALGNGNYVVSSPVWDNGAVVNVGAVTFGSGVSGSTGVVAPNNSLIGAGAENRVGSGAVALRNGNYVVVSPGAVTFALGSTGITGVVSPSNSLVGNVATDAVGSGGITVLANGSYVVVSPFWGNGMVANAGAVTLGSGSAGISGVVTAGNSLVGDGAGDLVGIEGVVALNNGNYVVKSGAWNNNALTVAGAITWGSGVNGVIGAVSTTNSLVGSTSSDFLGGNDAVTDLGNGKYLVSNPLWDNGEIVDAGSITLARSDGSVTGPITDEHSVLGLVANQGASQVYGYDALRNQLAVGQPASNRVVLHRTGTATSTSIVTGTPDPSISGQPVIFTASVSATPGAPTNGQVTFTASSGESCIDTTPSATSATTAEFSCTMALVAIGTSTVIAEYTGSVIHAYSGSAPETHTTISDVMFGDGFESP